MEPVMICAIFPHPDDESFGVAGSVAFYRARGVRSALICTTRGAAGMCNGLAETPAELAAVRSEEFVCAARTMGAAAYELLDFADGAGQKWDCSELGARLEGILARWRPPVVVTFDKDGVTRHPDHIAVHSVVTGLIIAHGQELGVRRLFYQVVTCPEEASPEGPSLACVPPETVDVSVDIRPFEPVKRAALACHRTQAADTAHLLDLPPGSLRAEHYQLAWSADGWRPCAGGADLLVDLVSRPGERALHE
jgi:LmbE family N-acetylglucosaminyl deacetylase